MEIAAVTGTNGKTSTVEFARQLLASTGRSAASYGTLGLVEPSGRDPDPPTSVGAAALPHLFSRLSVDAVALEAFSTGLDADVFAEVTADVAAFTSFDRDHLDYHGSLEAYFRAKRHLFTSVLSADGTAVINADADRSGRLLERCQERGVDVLSVGTDGGVDLRLVESRPTDGGTAAVVDLAGRRLSVDVPVVGEMMCLNALCAVGLCLALGVPPDDAGPALSDLDPPPGRVERVATHHGAPVYVDYAHTPAALRAVLATLAERTPGDLVVVFGCGGSCDRGKRDEMGAVAADGADRVVVTDDNPRDEDPAGIRAAVLEGCPGALEIAGRERAIDRALDLLGPDDALVVAGRGHETEQEIAGERRQFSDRVVVRELAGDD